MQLRYSYRLYPTSGQQTKLAKAFGCARVVFNDALSSRRHAYADMNAATNILAAGQTERLNACEGQVGPAPGLAPAVEAGTHQDSSTAVVGILTSDGGADVNTEHTSSRSS
ncbi:helix-turn-helix domain-containing protein [Nocardia vinacea]|uniref:helix-turn-helix domain-containing protein n=1 Tax=Nocardia vinacea TaxID=96468 RepID=UPI00247A47B8|nr:helix-turn-helix domain-containing protein [Nocardia vinacea]